MGGWKYHEDIEYMSNMTICGSAWYVGMDAQYVLEECRGDAPAFSYTVLAIYRVRIFKSQMSEYVDKNLTRTDGS